MGTKIYHQPLVDFSRKKEFFVGVDSDGCVFDSMELKHKECFCPAFISSFRLQEISSLARETWEYVNLYSKNRGMNRFLSVHRALDLLRTNSQVPERGISILPMHGLGNWLQESDSLTMESLELRIKKTRDPDLEILWNWSIDVNTAIKKIVRGLSPFPAARKALEEISTRADIMVISQTPGLDLNREWEEHEIHSYPELIAGQELGTKTEHLSYGAVGKYPQDKILMIGDAPGDLYAARENGIAFFPILPGKENDSWVRFLDIGIGKFFDGSYAGEYEARLIEEFEGMLP